MSLPLGDGDPVGDNPSVKNITISVSAVTAASVPNDAHGIETDKTDDGNGIGSRPPELGDSCDPDVPKPFPGGVFDGAPVCVTEGSSGQVSCEPSRPSADAATGAGSVDVHIADLSECFDSARAVEESMYGGQLLPNLASFIDSPNSPAPTVPASPKRARLDAGAPLGLSETPPGPSAQIISVEDSPDFTPAPVRNVRKWKLRQRDDDELPSQSFAPCPFSGQELAPASQLIRQFAEAEV
eukprot:5066327-Pyramimonas_sp.AAC.1